MRKLKLSFILLSIIFLVSCSGKTIQNQNIVSSTTTIPDSEPYQLSCPRGITDDPAPGQCFRYTDKDNDGFCDYGQ